MTVASIPSSVQLGTGDEQMRLPSLSRVYYLIVSAIAFSQKRQDKLETYHKMHFDSVDVLSATDASR